MSDTNAIIAALTAANLTPEATAALVAALTAAAPAKPAEPAIPTQTSYESPVNKPQQEALAKLKAMREAAPLPGHVQESQAVKLARALETERLLTIAYGGAA